MENQEMIKNILSCLNRYAFTQYVFSLFKMRDGIQDEKFDRLIPYTLTTSDLSETCGKYVFEQHHYAPPEFQSFTGIFVYTEPIDLFYKLLEVNIATPAIVKNLKKYKKLMWEREQSWFFPQDGTFSNPEIAFVTNYSDIPRDDYDKVLFPKFSKLLKNWDDEPGISIGSIDSFLELSEGDTKKNLENFMSNYKDGLTISLIDDKFSIDNFLANNYISDGVLRDSKNPCESTFVKTTEKNQIILEFEHLINNNSKESDLESFLKRYYQDVFGPEYNEIETQLWLKFPELDISQSERRLDIFLRNSIEEDWELFEIKKATKLTTTYRGMPVFRHEVQNAIQQLRNYNSILSQDSVKRKMAKEGIEYYVPTLKLVIGRSPNVSPSQWRWLKSTNEKDVKILTYDDLLKSMKKRHEFHIQYL